MQLQEQERNLNTYLNNIPYEYKYLSLTQTTTARPPHALRQGKLIFLDQNQR